MTGSKLLAGGMVDRSVGRRRYDAHFRYAVATSLIALPFLLVCNLFAMLGPVLVGALTDQMFHDKAKIGASLAIVVGVSIILAVLVLSRTMRQARERLDPAPRQETYRA